jgi:hypothetical protein
MAERGIFTHRALRQPSAVERRERSFAEPQSNRGELARPSGDRLVVFFVTVCLPLINP